VDKIPAAAVGAIVAAIVTSLIAALGLIISKENKTSEFRQAWIDALRADLAGFIGHVNALVGSVRIAGRSKEGWIEARDDIIGLNKCLASIRLRLNPSERRCEGINKLLEEMEQSFANQVGTLPEKRISELEKLLLVEGQALLKEEWLRVGRGEPFFRFTRWAAVAALVVSAFALFGTLGRP
jgi:hypothetical protein